MPCHQAELDRLVKAADADGNGEIDFDEFLAVRAWHEDMA